MLVLLFWFTLAVIVYVYAGYPLFMYWRSRTNPQRWTQAEINAKVSIIMAVHNGAALLRDRIDDLLRTNSDHELGEIVVVSDGSNDATNQILAEISDPRVVTVICPEHRGKANALNHGIRWAGGDILVFVDIRPRLEKGALRQLVSNFADPNVGCVAGELCLRTSGHDGSTKAVSSLYWRYEQAIRKCESLVDSPVNVYGGFYAVRREVVANFPDGLILDDMYQPLSIVRQGFRSVIDDNARVWDVWPKTSAAEFQRKVRTLAGNYQLVQRARWLLRRANRLRFQLVSHKLLRLPIPFLLLFLFVASYALRAAQPYADILYAQAAFYGLAFTGFIRELPLLRKLTGPASAFVLLNAAALTAFVMFLRRRHSLLRLWVTPQPASDVQPLSTS